MTADIDDATLARELAQGAGEILKGARSVGLLRSSALGDAGDYLAQAWIARCLEQHRPEDAVLSEEAPDDGSRLSKKRVWIIDPLDGTREYADERTERSDWAVHIALAIDGKIEHAAVGIPALNRVFHTGDIAAPTGELTNRLVISHNSTSDAYEFIARETGMELVQMGSCGAKTVSVLLGDNDAYVHEGGQYMWDNAAPMGLAQAAGLHTSRLDGSEFDYAAQDTYVPDLLVCRPELRDRLLAATRKYVDQH